MHKTHNEHITKLCNKDTLRAPVLFLAQKHSFFSDSQSSYSKYDSFAILKNNCTSALKSVVVRAVDWLLIRLDKSTQTCAQNAHNLVFMLRAKFSNQSYELVVQSLYSALMTSIFSPFTPLKPLLYTSSTVPIKTIYLNKEVNK